MSSQDTEGAGPSQPVRLFGTDVGQLDPTQRTRLLGTPGSRLSFANYDPLTAFSHERKASLSPGPNTAKRIVIETFPNGSSTWRWVPRAKGVESISEEGQWPRVIEICGQSVLCSQDQWDIYKLDPEYDCIVDLSSGTTRITQRTEESKEHLQKQSSKRSIEEAESDSEEDTRSSQHKKARPAEVDSDEEDDTVSDDEVEDLIADSGLDEEHRRRTNKVSERRQQLDERRRDRRGRVRAHTERRMYADSEDVSMTDLTLEDTPPQQESQASTGSAPADTDSGFYEEDVPEPAMPGTWTESTAQNKATRDATTANGSPQRDAQASANASQQDTPRQADPPPRAPAHAPTPLAPSKRLKRGVESPTEPIAKRLHTQKFAKRRPPTLRRSEKKPSVPPRTFAGGSNGPDAWAFMESVNFSFSTRSKSSSQSTRSSSTTEDDLVRLKEKIKRMQEINEYERAREAAAREEERKRSIRAAEAERLRQLEEQERRAREQAERERRERELERMRRIKEQLEREERARRQREAEERARRQEARWTTGPWTTLRALEHYRAVSEAFDKVQFSAENPVSFLSIPWPVLHRPTKYAVEDIDWQAVETFFESVRGHMKQADFKAFVEKSHRRFHPDRWRARRVLQCVVDEETRAGMEVAANTVAQAITPIWSDVKGSG